VGTPSLNSPAHQPYWVGGVIADPDQLAAVQYALSGAGLEMYWESSRSRSAASAPMRRRGFTTR
jgi:hypothetical protein